MLKHTHEPTHTSATDDGWTAPKRERAREKEKKKLNWSFNSERKNKCVRIGRLHCKQLRVLYRGTGTHLQAHNYISKHHSDIYVVRWYKIRCQDNGQTELSISVFTGTQETHAALIKMYTHTHSRIFWSHLPNSFEIKVSISIPLNEFSEATNADFELSNVGSGRPTNFQLSLTA